MGDVCTEARGDADLVDGRRCPVVADAGDYRYFHSSNYHVFD
jgi:hypothetical protein